MLGNLRLTVLIELFLYKKECITLKVINRLCWFSIANSRLQLSSLFLNLKKNRSKIATLKVPERENAKWPPRRHQIQIFKNRNNNCQIMAAKFNQNRHNRLGCRASTYRHTDRNAYDIHYTHTHTHTLGFHCNIFSSND